MAPGGKELGKRPFYFLVVYSSRLCRCLYLSDGICPTLWDQLPPCSSSTLNRIGRISKNHEQPPRHVHGKFKQHACACIIMMTIDIMFHYSSLLKMFPTKIQHSEHLKVSDIFNLNSQLEFQIHLKFLDTI